MHLWMARKRGIKNCAFPPPSFPPLPPSMCKQWWWRVQWFAHLIGYLRKCLSDGGHTKTIKHQSGNWTYCASESWQWWLFGCGEWEETFLTPVWAACATSKEQGKCCTCCCCCCCSWWWSGLPCRTSAFLFLPCDPSPPPPPHPAMTTVLGSSLLHACSLFI